jgi:hypothetical protein
MVDVDTTGQLDAEKKFEWFTGITALFAHTNE